MDIDLDIARRDAAELERLKKSAELLPQLEQQEQQRLERERLEKHQAHLTLSFEEKMEQFRQAKSESDERLNQALDDLLAVCQERKQLYQLALEIFRIAQNLAMNELRLNGTLDPAQVALSQDMINGQVEQIFIDKTGFPSLMHYRPKYNQQSEEGELILSFLQTLSRLTGDILVKPKNEKFQGFSIAQSNGRYKNQI